MPHRLTDAGLSDVQADAIAGAVRQAAEAGGAVTPEMLRAEIATVRTEIATEIGAVRTEIGTLRTEIAKEFGAVRTEIGAVRADLYRVAAGQTIAIIVAVVAILRFFG